MKRQGDMSASQIYSILRNMVPLHVDVLICKTWVKYWLEGMEGSYYYVTMTFFSFRGLFDLWYSSSSSGFFFLLTRWRLFLQLSRILHPFIHLNFHVISRFEAPQTLYDVEWGCSVLNNMLFYQIIELHLEVQCDVIDLVYFTV